MNERTVGLGIDPSTVRVKGALRTGGARPAPGDIYPGRSRSGGHVGATGDALYRITAPPRRGRIWVCDNL